MKHLHERLHLDPPFLRQRNLGKVTESVPNGKADGEADQDDFPDRKSLGTEEHHGYKQINQGCCLIGQLECPDLETKQNENIQIENDKYDIIIGPVAND